MIGPSTLSWEMSPLPVMRTSAFPFPAEIVRSIRTKPPAWTITSPRFKSPAPVPGAPENVVVTPDVKANVLLPAVAAVTSSIVRSSVSLMVMTPLSNKLIAANWLTSLVPSKMMSNWPVRIEVAPVNHVGFLTDTEFVGDDAGCVDLMNVTIGYDSKISVANIDVRFEVSMNRANSKIRRHYSWRCRWSRRMSSHRWTEQEFRRLSSFGYCQN